MRAKRVDANLMPIVEAARDLGFLVHVRNDDLADLDVQFPLGRHEIWEVKTPTGHMTPLQIKHRKQCWRIRTVRTVDDVIKARKEIL